MPGGIQPDKKMLFFSPGIFMTEAFHSGRVGKTFAKLMNVKFFMRV